MSGYNLDRLVTLTTLMSRPVDQDVLFEVALKESMLIGNCDGGTIYTIEDNKLMFRYIYTISKSIAMNYQAGSLDIPPVPMQKQYACAYSAITKKRLNLKDVYVSKEFDFTGTRNYDAMNNYRTCSMLVVPMLVGNGEVMGVLQLINAKDKYGMWIPFTQEQEMRVSAVASITALYLENLKLKGQLAELTKKEDSEENDSSGKSRSSKPKAKAGGIGKKTQKKSGTSGWHTKSIK
ncbi:GAF domain-containing protein [Butyrivibrio sp. DSM 10294]|uniref:GAF domain-containing protein n=1 Tax=Butyrivibrio sp. DSM 10294 TaxID=2972457 RepID=UPI00234F918F|nr:GAF domain-containing protein [Butyrivibrio sp. DSM 10294]MDC7293100.1 GAF domain-containing protein [Butyrivibrio sp. DSM 10294]